MIQKLELIRRLIMCMDTTGNVANDNIAGWAVGEIDKLVDEQRKSGKVFPEYPTMADEQGKLCFGD